MDTKDRRDAGEPQAEGMRRALEANPDLVRRLRQGDVFALASLFEAADARVTAVRRLERRTAP